MKNSPSWSSFDRLMLLSISKVRTLRSGAVLLLTMLVLSTCKANSGDGAKLKGMNDGSCSQYQRRLDALMLQLQKIEGSSNDEEGYWLYNPAPSFNNEPKKYTIYSDKSQASNIAELEQQIEDARRDLSICMRNKAGESGTMKIPGNGDAGHCDYNGQNYDILNYNCHSAANQSVSDNPFTTGIVSCRGLEPVYGSPAHHTFNYRVERNLIVYYNWGQTCKAPRKQLPPDISDPDHQACARLFCGNQYGDDTLALPIGQKVEQPGPLYCSSTSTSKSSCNSCCQYRGKFWDSASQRYRPDDLNFKDFMSQCYTACAQNFGH